MVTKLHKTGKSATPNRPADRDPEALASSVKDSAQQIWQAGLGAFSKAQAEGSRAYEALVKEGTSLQRKTQAAAEERITEATSRMTNMATDISSKASGHWDKLENIFEERVAKALNKLGVPSAKDVNALIARIDALKQSVQELSADKARSAKPAAAKKAKARSATPTPAPAKKAPAKKATKAVRRTPAKRSVAAGKPAAN
nr:putative phasin family protein [uncultured bacterium]